MMGNVYGAYLGEPSMQSGKNLSTGESVVLYLTFLIGEYQGALSSECFCPSSDPDRSDAKIKWLEASLKELRETRTRLEAMIAERDMI